MIHVYNKNENAIHSSDYFDNIRHRENLLLLGDSLGDLRMAEGAGDLKCMLKIGFLNFKVSITTVWDQRWQVMVLFAAVTDLHLTSIFNKYAQQHLASVEETICSRIETC